MMTHAIHYNSSTPVLARRIQHNRLEVVQWVAFIAMIVDHIGYIFSPDDLWLRMIGRVAFPMFSLVFAWRLAHILDKNPHHSLMPMICKLFVSGVMAQLAWINLQLASTYNVMFLFLSCVITILLIDEDKPIFELPTHIRLLSACVFLLSVGMHLDYGYFGIFLVLGSYAFFKWGSIEGLILAMGSYFILNQSAFVKGTFLAAILVVVIFNLRFKINKKIPNFFYWAYPSHLILLALLV